MLHFYHRLLTGLSRNKSRHLNTTVPDIIVSLGPLMEIVSIAGWLPPDKSGLGAKVGYMNASGLSSIYNTVH